MSPNLGSKTVLTDSTWRYVEIFLKEKKQNKALMYWNQAQNFFEATENLSLISKPLTSYYCFLNATKALLTYKKIRFDVKHGVSGKRIDKRYNLQNETITIFPSGVLSGLCTYFKEHVKPEKKGETYTLKEIFYNLEYIHRAYTLTYNNKGELFIPIENCRFVHEDGKAWFEAKLDETNSTNSIMKSLSGFGIDYYYDNSTTFTIRRNKKFDWNTRYGKPDIKSLRNLKNYYFNIRSRLTYIYSPNKLWYIKRNDLKGVINKNSTILTFAAMHRLSELSRYNPDILDKHLNGKSSWLISEFITKSLLQFIDSISSEITGDDFRVTGFRT